MKIDLIVVIGKDILENKNNNTGLNWARND